MLCAMDLPRSTPDELIEELRSDARTSSLDIGDDVPLDGLMGWEAADWIEQACRVLEQIKSSGGDQALAASELLAGEYPVGADDRRNRWHA